MSSHVTAYVLHGDLPAFTMNAVALPLFGSESGEHSEICLTQKTKHLQSLASFPRRIITQERPQILIEAGQLRTLILEHLTVAPAAGQFVLSQVRQYLGNGPFVRFRPKVKICVVDSLDDFCQQLRSAALHEDWVFTLNEPRETVLILICSFNHVALRCVCLL